jgi:hypothetical protein
MEEAVDNLYNWTKSEMVRFQIAPHSQILQPKNLGQGKDVHEPSMIESMLRHAERLGISSEETDDHVKEIANIFFGGMSYTLIACQVI